MLRFLAAARQGWGRRSTGVRRAEDSEEVNLLSDLLQTLQLCPPPVAVFLWPLDSSFGLNARFNTLENVEWVWGGWDIILPMKLLALNPNQFPS